MMGVGTSGDQARQGFSEVKTLCCIVAGFISLGSVANLFAQEPEQGPGREPGPEKEALVEKSSPSAKDNDEPVAAGLVANKAEVSVYEKISVIGSQQHVRSSIVSMAENIRVELNKICGEARRKMKLPIIVRLYGAEGDQEQARSVVSKITRLQEQYHLMLHVHLARGVDRSLLRYHLMELFLYERGLGDGQFVAEGERVIVRPWLIIGMLEAMDIKSGRADKRIYQVDFNYLEVLPLQQIFDTTEKQWFGMIGREPVAFRAISGAMVNSLLRQPGGRASMASYLADFPTFKGEQENLLRKHFPGMNKSTNSLQKWVDLELLELGTARVTQVHSILETESRLDELLKLRYRDETGAALSVDVGDYHQVIELEEQMRREAVAGARSELERLSYRCFPTHRPLLNEYGIILRDIIMGKSKGIDERLAKLNDVRMKMKDSALRTRDYLDWYYITRSTEVSGDFEKYRALMDAIEKEKLSSPVNDTTEKYLDDIERIYGRGSR